MVAAVSHPQTESFEPRVIPGGRWAERADRDPMPHREREQLRYFLTEYESDVGLRSSHPDAVAAMCRCGGGGPNVIEDHAVQLCDRKSTATANRVRRALQRLPGHHVVVLWKLHGPHSPSRDLAVFGALGAVVDMTDAVERVREDLALREGEARETAVAASLARTLPEIRDHYAEVFWTFAGAQIADAAKLAHATAAAPRGEPTTRFLPESGRSELERRAKAWPGVLAGILLRYRNADVCPVQGQLSARLSALASADRELTHQAALRHALAPYGGPRGPKGQPHAAPHAAWKATREAFVDAARSDALQLRAEATSSYLEALGATS